MRVSQDVPPSPLFTDNFWLQLDRSTSRMLSRLPVETCKDRLSSKQIRLLRSCGGGLHRNIIIMSQRRTYAEWNTLWRWIKMREWILHLSGRLLSDGGSKIADKQQGDGEEHTNLQQTADRALWSMRGSRAFQ